jgi:hypothetical protein
MNSRTLIWCHGGCFAGGSIEYDKELREYLVQNGVCNVFPVNFSLDSWEGAISDITLAAQISSQIGIVPGKMDLILGGISSGALMAHEVANRLKLPAVLICPVIKPATRHDTLPEDLKKKQLTFFGTREHMHMAEDSIQSPNKARYILYGKQDQRAPSSAFESWLTLDHVVSDALDQGHEICNKPPCALIAKRVETLFAT